MTMQFLVCLAACLTAMTIEAAVWPWTVRWFVGWQRRNQARLRPRSVTWRMHKGSETEPNDHPVTQNEDGGPG